jgi:adenylate cyclase
MSAKILLVDVEPDLEALLVQKFRRQIREGAVRFLFAHDGLEALSLIASNRDIGEYTPLVASRRPQRR